MRLSRLALLGLALAAVLLSPAPALATLTLVQETGKVRNNGTGTLECTFGVLPTIGNTIIIMVFGWSSGASPAFDATDNQSGNTYTTQVSRDAAFNFGESAIISGTVVGSAGTFTITLHNHGTGAFANIANCQEWSGITSVTADKTTSATGSSAAPSTGTTATTTQNEELLVGVTVANSNQSWTANSGGSNPSSGWTMPINETDSATFQAGAAVYRTVNATGAYVHVWADTTSDNWSGVIATFKGAAGGGGGTPPTRSLLGVGK